jgi:hypothetical protein
VRESDDRDVGVGRGCHAVVLECNSCAAFYPSLTQNTLPFTQFVVKLLVCATGTGGWGRGGARQKNEEARGVEMRECVEGVAAP